MAYAEIRGVNLYYEDLGQGDPVVLIHGLGSSARSWRHQVPAMAEAGYRVVTHDLRGHCRSGQASSCTVADSVSDLAGLLDHLGIESAHLVGLSAGGNIALQFALDYPHRARGLVLTSCVSEVNTRALHERLVNLIGPGLERRMYRLLGQKRMARLQSRSMYAPDKAPESYRLFLEDALAVRTDCLFQLRRSLAGFNVTDRLGEIRCPVLVVRGTGEVIPARYTEILHRGLPDSRLALVERAGHMTGLDNPADFNRVVLEFLNGIES